MKLIRNGFFKSKIHIYKSRGKDGFEKTLCNINIPSNAIYLFEGDISQVTCKRCLKAYKESEK